MDSFSDWVLFRKLLASLVLPPAGPLICAVIGLMLGDRHYRLGRSLLWLGVLSLFLLSTPLMSEWLTAKLGDGPALDLARRPEAQAIVIIGGGVRQAPTEYGGDSLSVLTLERVRYGAYLAARTGLPVLVSGGAVRPGQPEAELMQAALEQEFRVPVRWVEKASRDTHENARYSAPMLAASNVETILLVSHAFDARRARREFESAGLEVVGAPAGAGLNSDGRLAVSDFIPNARALLGSYYACYELLGLMVMHARTAWTGLPAPDATGGSDAAARKNPR
jgi:uncharacterized SAM-binding protein YcdF (DUF218 family)